MAFIVTTRGRSALRPHRAATDEEIEIFVYRIERHANKFVALDSTDEVIGIYDTEETAKQDIERMKLHNAIYKHTKVLFHAAIASVMDVFGVDYRTARHWVEAAAGGR
jgi:CRISPR/Cas system Type II protein with McrA/HNH and RuvC-like nuclease domain